MVKLVYDKQELTVSVAQAEAILHVQSESKNLSQWQLPEDSPYKLVNGKLIECGRSEVIQGTATQKRNRAGRKA